MFEELEDWDWVEEIGVRTSVVEKTGDEIVVKLTKWLDKENIDVKLWTDVIIVDVGVNKIVFVEWFVREEVDNMCSDWRMVEEDEKFPELEKAGVFCETVLKYASLTVVSKATTVMFCE